MGRGEGRQQRGDATHDEGAAGWGEDEDGDDVLLDLEEGVLLVGGGHHLGGAAAGMRIGLSGRPACDAREGRMRG